MNVWSLISDDSENVSMGKIAFWILMINDIFFWWFKAAKDFPDSLYYITLYVLLYNFGKKLVSPIKDFLDAKSPKDLTDKLSKEISQ